MRLTRGPAGDVPETPKPGDPVFDRVTNHILTDTFTAFDAAHEVANNHKYESLTLSSRVRGEAHKAAKTHVAVAGRSLAAGNPITIPAVVLSDGECAVTVYGDGDDRPNLEFYLAAIAELPDEAALASIGSDRKDGGAEVVGVVVDASSVATGDAHVALAKNNALPVPRETGAPVGSDAAGTNVNGLRALVVSEGIQAPAIFG